MRYIIIVIPILQKQLRLRELKLFSQDHTASKQQSLGVNPAPQWIPEYWLLTIPAISPREELQAATSRGGDVIKWFPAMAVKYLVS